MAVSPAEFQIALNKFLRLDAVDTDDNGFITAIAVTIEGIIGSKEQYGRAARMDYRLLVGVQNLGSELPEAWIVSPQDSAIEHVNIWRANKTCPLTGKRLPRICWGTSGTEWMDARAGHRTLANFLEVAQQVLANANFESAARS